MTRDEWKAAHRRARSLATGSTSRLVTIEHAGRPFKLIRAPYGVPIRVMACRIADRPNAQLIARELAEAAEDRRRLAFYHLRRNAIRAHRLSIEAARAWRLDEWRERVRRAAQLAEAQP